MTENETKQKLIDGGKVLAMEGQADFTRGHISVRRPGEPGQFFMKPHSVGFDEITMENMLLIDLDGNVVAGTARRHSEVYIHSEIFRARPDVNCVIHTHSPSAVALSATGRPIRPLSQPSALFVDKLPVYDASIDLIRTAEMGRDVAASLGRHDVVLMKCHGIAVAGSSIEHAVVLTLMLEEACRIQLLVDATGHSAPEFSDEQVLALREKLSRLEQFVVNFEYLRRKANRTSIG
jgi:L-fuculose-phosphate aldolase